MKTKMLGNLVLSPSSIESFEAHGHVVSLGIVEELASGEARQQFFAQQSFLRRQFGEHSAVLAGASKQIKNFQNYLISTTLYSV